MVRCMERVQCLCLRHSHRLLLRNDPPHRLLRHSLNLSGIPSLAPAAALAATIADPTIAAAALTAARPSRRVEYARRLGHLHHRG